MTADIYAYTEYMAVLQHWRAIYNLGKISRAVSVDLRFDLAKYSVDVAYYHLGGGLFFIFPDYPDIAPSLAESEWY